MIRKFQSGQIPSANEVNEIVRMAGGGLNIGQGGGLAGGGDSPTARSGDPIVLVKAQADFAPEAGETDVWSGNCKVLEYYIPTKQYIEVSPAFKVYCNTTDASPAASGAKFRAIFNRSTGRWERLGPPIMCRGIAVADIAKGFTGDVKIYLGVNGETDTGETLTARAVVGDVVADAVVYYQRLDYGYEIIQTECE